MSLQIESLRDDLNQRDDKISRLNMNLDRNLKLVSKQKKRISDVLEETNERESQIVTLESQIETLNLTIETLKMTIETKSRALNEAEACILDAENSRGETMTLSSQHISDLETKNADLKVEMEVLRHDMSRRQSVVVKDLRSEMESLRAELKVNVNTISSLSVRLRIFRTQMMILRRRTRNFRTRTPISRRETLNFRMRMRI